MIQAALDLPLATEPSDPLTIRVQGWVFAAARHSELAAIEAVADGNAVVGRTTLLYPRPDVSASLGIAADVATGFSLLGCAPTLVARHRMRLSIRARFADGSTETILERDTPLTGRDYRAGDWSILLDPAFPHIVHREQMYNSGPSQEAPSRDLLELLERYLPRREGRILDVGCGPGAYGEALRARGRDWFGVEIKESDCATLTRKELPHLRADGHALPFTTGEFDTALCLEVLEHLADPWSFITEVRRVISRRLLVSVPNLELVPYWRPHLAVPWHLLEADHRNFFSRTSLRELLQPHFRSVEVIGYGEAPLRTVEGASLDYHLLAIADV